MKFLLAFFMLTTIAAGGIIYSLEKDLEVQQIKYDDMDREHRELREDFQYFQRSVQRDELYRQLDETK